MLYVFIFKKVSYLLKYTHVDIFNDFTVGICWINIEMCATLQVELKSIDYI